MNNGLSDNFSHLLELRKRLIKVIIFFFFCLISIYPFSQSIFSELAAPLLNQLGENSLLIATEVIAPFLAPFKLVCYISLIATIPFLLWQIWAFVTPGLYPEEKKTILPLVFISVILFVTGISFSYFLVLPIIFSFIVQIAPKGVQVMPDISAYLDFVCNLMITFGIAFEWPIIVFFIIKTEIISAEALKAKRPYFIILAFTIGMLLTPPDVISQTMLAIPLCLLFELGLLMAKIFKSKKT